MKLTNWYPACIKPIRIGWYHTKADEPQEIESPYNWFWDGEVWRVNADFQSRACRVQNRVWRGIAK